MSTLTEQWLEHLQTDRAMSPRTVATYARTMRTLPEADTADREHIEAWWRSRTHLSVATRANELSAVRSFYKWAIRWEHRDDDPTIRLDAPKIPHGLPRPASRADVIRLLRELDGPMRRAICLGAYGGLRVSEAASLRWSDIDTEHHRMRITGKGNKVRLVGLNPVLLDSILPDTGGNVVTGESAGWSAAVLQQRVNRAIKTSGVDVTFHQLRHRFGTQAVGSGVSLLAVSRAMGHSSPASTMIYAATSDADLDLIAEAVTR
jgi:site-specific recombinase XerD